MDIVDQIKMERDTGRVTCRIQAALGSSVAEAARRCSLAAQPEIYTEIDREAALALVTFVLGHELIEGEEIMPRDRAAALSEGLFERFPDDASFFTNGTFHQAVIGALEWDDVQWEPATLAEVDTGVLMVSPERVACLWVEDNG